MELEIWWVSEYIFAKFEVLVISHYWRGTQCACKVLEELYRGLEVLNKEE